MREDGIALADDTTGGRGDLVVTRRNDRRLTYDDNGTSAHVRNGTLWRIENAHPDGSIEVTAPTGATGAQIRLPAEYVRDHVELGYAATVHRAQGMTVDHAHTIAAAAMTRQSFYVAMTRGRDANHAYVATDTMDTTCPSPTGAEAPTGRDVLRQVLATDGAERSATATLRRRQDDATSLRRLLPIRDLLSRAEHDPEAARAVEEINAIIRARRADTRPAHGSPYQGPTGPEASRPAPPGMQR